MKYKINQEFLDSHYNVETDIINLVESQEGDAREFFELLVEKPLLSYDIFGSDGGVNTLEQLRGLLHSLNHWIVDDGEYSIVRYIDTRSVKHLNTDLPKYKYEVTSGWSKDSVSVSIKDMLKVAHYTIDASEYYNQYSDLIETSLFAKGESCFKVWNEKDKAGKKYLEQCWKERSYENV